MTLTVLIIAILIAAYATYFSNTSTIKLVNTVVVPFNAPPIDNTFYAECTVSGSMFLAGKPVNCVIKADKPLQNISIIYTIGIENSLRNFIDSKNGTIENVSSETSVDPLYLRIEKTSLLYFTLNLTAVDKQNNTIDLGHPFETDFIAYDFVDVLNSENQQRLAMTALIISFIGVVASCVGVVIGVAISLKK